MSPNASSPPIVAHETDPPPHGAVDLDTAPPSGAPLSDALYYRVEWTTDPALYGDAAARDEGRFFPADSGDGFEQTYLQEVDVTLPAAVWQRWVETPSVRRVYVRVGAGPRPDVTDPEWQWSPTPTEIVINHDPVARVDAPPALVVGPDGAAVRDLSLDASSSSDPDAGTHLSFAWSLQSAPPTCDPEDPWLSDLLTRLGDAAERFTVVPAGTIVPESCRGSYTLQVAVTDDDPASHFSMRRGHDATRVTVQIRACPLCIGAPTADAPARVDRFGRAGARIPRDVEIRWAFDPSHHAELREELGEITVLLTIYRQPLEGSGQLRKAIFQSYDQPAGVTGRVVWSFADNVTEGRWTGDQVGPGTYDLELTVFRSRDNTFMPPEIVSELGAIRLDDFAFWADLMSFRPPLRTQTLLSQRLGDSRPYHPIEDAYGDLNLDYYPVRITRLPEIDGVEATPEAFFRTMRIGIDDFFVGSGIDLVPYEPSDQRLWESDDPVGTVRIFQIPPDSGAVQCTLSEPRRFRFSTIYLRRFPQVGPYAHPVAGNREWGIVADDDGGYTVYTRGADRVEGLVSSLVAFAAFRGAHQLWTTWQQRVVDYVNANGGQAELLDPISTREDWDALSARYYRPVTPWAWEVR